MISKRLWHVQDKWKRHISLAGHQRLSKYIPPTRIFSNKSFNEFSQRYKVIFLKPVKGSLGNNIIKVTKTKRGYFVHRENKVRRVASGSIAQDLFRNVRGRRYLIQQGVPLLTIKGKPIDFRVLVLKPNKKWEIMGTMGKVATGNRIVTNYNHGGRPIRVVEALRQVGWNQEEIRRVHTQMNKVSLTAAQVFNNKYPHCRRLGVDIAIDANKRVWILEVNTNPFFELFRHHANKQLYGKIRRYMDKIGKQQSNR